MLPLLLASSSVYRRELLSRLHLPFHLQARRISMKATAQMSQPSNWSSAWPKRKPAPSPPAIQGT